MACAALFTVTMLAHIQAQTPATLVGEGGVSAADRLPMAQPAGQALSTGSCWSSWPGARAGAAGTCGAMIVAAAPGGCFTCRLRPAADAWRRPGHSVPGGAVLQDLAVGPALDPAFQAGACPHLERRAA